MICMLLKVQYLNDYITVKMLNMLYIIIILIYIYIAQYPANTACSTRCISPIDVINEVSHLKNGKSDGSEGLFSDHFLHATHRFYLILSILYTLFSSHGFSPDSMIMGTIIPIPKNRKQSLCNSSNYRAIALSSIFGKILDWVILIKEESALCIMHYYDV